MFSGNATAVLGTIDDNADVTTATSITPYINSTALIENYVVDTELFELTNQQPSFNYDNTSFGITILMMNFAQFYARDQYILFAYTFRCVKEILLLEQFLLRYNQKSIILPSNMATDDRYGLKQLGRSQCDPQPKLLLTVCDFERLVDMMGHKDTTPTYFIQQVWKYDINIIEAFFMFTSITKDCKIIKECHNNLMGDNFSYKFTKIVPQTNTSDALYFCNVPPKTVWFGYSQRRIKFSAFVDRNTEMLVKYSLHFVPIDFVLFGYVENNIGHVIAFEQCSYSGKWQQIVEICNNYNISCPLKLYERDDSSRMLIRKKICFVKANDCTIYKLYNKKKKTIIDIFEYTILPLFIEEMKKK